MLEYVAEERGSGWMLHGNNKGMRLRTVEPADEPDLDPRRQSFLAQIEVVGQESSKLFPLRLLSGDVAIQPVGFAVACGDDDRDLHYTNIRWLSPSVFF